MTFATRQSADDELAKSDCATSERAPTRRHAAKDPHEGRGARGACVASMLRANTTRTPRVLSTAIDRQHESAELLTLLAAPLTLRALSLRKRAYFCAAEAPAVAG